jgi:hypothetical protein
MNIIIDLDLQQAVQGFGSRQPALPYQVKSQDTPTVALYFVRGNVTYDLGTSPGLRFGVFVAGNPNALVQQNTFTRTADNLARTVYVAYPNFNTVQMQTAIGSQPQLAVIGEIRYQTTYGTIARTADIDFTVVRSLMNETVMDNLIAAFVTPAVNANVTVRINNTGWLSAGLNISIAAGAGAYQVVSITNTTDFVAKNLGGASNAASGTTIPSGTAVGIAPVNVLQAYPDPSIIEVTTHKDVVNGYAGLDGTGLLKGTEMPVDAKTIVVSGGKLASSSILTTTTADFITPVANGTVPVTLASTSGLVAGQYVRIPIAGYYVVTSITDSTHAVLTNNGDPFNAGSGVTITSGAVLLPAQAAAGGGTAGQNAYTLTTASFVVPAVGATVSVALQSTSWLGGNGYYVFITGAGYYAVSSITDATHAVLTNAGGTSNAIVGTTVPSGATVSAAGPAGAPGAAGTAGAALSAYDALSSSFTMPAAAANVTISIANTAWLGVGQVIYIASAGYFQVASISSATQALVTNLNYPGNASAGGTIASGSKVSAGGLIGATGSGGAGKNAFTNLAANFTQPAVNATVSINVGTTAWMAVGQIVFVQGGGYYSVASITDLTDVVITNLGYAGNASPGATVTSGSTVAVTPGGLAGQAGTNAFTVTAASFTMPAAASPVTVTIGTSAWIAQGQNLYVAGAGYFSVSAVTDGTHVVLTNSGVPGNVVSGTVIAAGAQVSPAGSTGLQGATGATGPQGPAGSGGGGAGGIILPSAGIQDFDDFVSDANGDKRFKLGWVPNYISGTPNTSVITTTTGCDAPNKGNGVVGLHLASAAQGVWLSLTTSAFAPMMFVPALGILDIRFRIWIPSGETSSAYSLKKCGIFLVTGNAATQNGMYFLANLGNSPNWQCETKAANTATTTVSSVPITFGSWHTAQILTDATWANIQFIMDGTTLATNTAHIPAVLCAPGIGSEGFTGVPQDLLCDYCYYNYTFTR